MAVINVAWKGGLMKNVLVSLGPAAIQLSDLQNFLSGLNVPTDQTANQRSGMEIFLCVTDCR
jgi:hypothetical protein